MAGSSNLADLVVTFTAKGVEVLKKQLGEIKTSLESVQAGAEAVGRKATVAFATLTGTVGGFVTAGFAGSAQMGAMSFQMERLSRGIAGIFVPEMNKAIDTVGQLADWFTKLNRAQQDNIKRWVEAAAVGLGMAMILPKIFAGLTLVAGGFKAVAAAFAAGFSMTGIGALLPLVGIVATAVLSLATSARFAREGMSGFSAVLQPIATVFKKIEDAIAKIDWSSISANLEPVIDALGRLAISAIELATNALPVLIEVTSQILVPVFTLLADVVGTVAGLVNKQTLGWLAAAAAFVTVIKIIPVIVSAIRTVITALKALTISQIIQQAMSGPKGWAQLAIGIAAAGAALGAYLLVMNAVEDSQRKLAGNTVKLSRSALGAPGTLPTPAMHGPEALTATLTRLQQEALKRDHQALIRDYTKRTADNTTTIIDRLNRLVNRDTSAFKRA